MKVFITGSTGLLGKDVVPVLSKEHELFLLVRDVEKAKKFSNLKNINFVNGSLEDIKNFKETINNCDIVLHMAGTNNPSKSFKINYELTKKMVALCEKKQKIIYISSFNVTFKNPGQYSLSKKMAEKTIQESGLDYLIFRPTLLYNKNGNFYFAKLIKKIIKFPFVVQPNNGRYLLQPLLTDDFAKIILLGLNKIKNRIIPVAGKEPISIKELINLIILYTNTKHRFVISVPLWFLKIICKFIGINRDKIREIDENKTMDIKNIEREFNISLHSIRDMLPRMINYVKAT